MSDKTPCRRIAVVSTTRADYGLLVRPMQALTASGRFDIDLILTGQHVCGQSDIRLRAAQDGLNVADAFPIHLAGDDGVAAAKALGLATLAFADAFSRCRPDLVMVLGDRYEILAPVQAALLAGIPVAHLCGGDRTEGAFDDAIRNAVSKLSHLHFPATERAARRLAALGEPGDRVTVTGSPGLDFLLTTPLPSRQALFDYLGMSSCGKFLLVTFHPVTLRDDSLAQVRELVQALRMLVAQAAVIVTGCNADPEGRAVEEVLKEFCACSQGGARFVPSLGPDWYPAALAYAGAVVGNSSSGLYEAPSLKTPTVDIGDRQKGRERAASVFWSPPDASRIVAAVRQALAFEWRDVVNPYGDGRASKRILSVLSAIPDFRSLLRKSVSEEEV